jgi:beta-lactamase regulating signal transducer with metallopeptidase domain
MNALGIVLAWTAVQVTLFCLAGTGVYLVTRRHASGASVLCGILIITVGIAAFAFSPWPRWWTADLRPVAQRSAPIPAAMPVAETPSSAQPVAADATDKPAPQLRGSVVPERMRFLLFGLWNRVRKELADPSPTEKIDARWRWPAWLAAVMLSGMGIGLARVVLGITALTKLLRETRPVDDPELLRLIEQLRGTLGCRRPIEVREMTCSGGGSPAVVGWRRPNILLPAEWRSWSEEARRGILAHETAHVAQGDFLMWLAAQAGVVVHFYNPLVHWLASRLRLEQELAADACGAALASGAKAYANLLAHLALEQDEFRPLWAGRPFFPTRGTLMRRIEMLHNQPIGGRRSPSRIWRTILLTTLASLGFAVSGLRGPLREAQADEASTANDSEKAESQTTDRALLPSFDDSYLPADTIAVLSVKPLKVANSTVVIEPCLLSFPQAFNLGFSTAANGVDEVKFVVFSPAQSETSSSKTQEPAVVGIFRMHKPYERNKMRVRLFGEAPDGVNETTCHGYPCFQATSDVSGLFVNYLLVDDRTLVIVRDRDVPRLLTAGAESHPSWYGEWQKVADRSLAVGFDSAAMDELDEPKDSAEEVFFSALKKTSHFFGGIDSTTEGLLLNGTAFCKSSEAAIEVSQAAKAALALARMALPHSIVPTELPEEYKTIDIVGTLTESLGGLSLEVNATRVELQGKVDAAFAAQFAEATKALMTRQTEEYKAREPADEQAHVVKLGKLAEAFNAYHADHGHYPPAAVLGPDGKTLHSWRVELLPFLGEQKLFDEYKLDETWDSEHNKTLVAKIPSIYSTSVWTQKGDSDYFVITGKGTLFDADEPGRRESVADAPGETILVIQSNQHIPWTKPIDIETTADHNAVRPFRGHGKGLYAAFADGTVKFVTKETDAASVRAMFTKAGGDEVKLR